MLCRPGKRFIDPLIHSPASVLVYGDRNLKEVNEAPPFNQILFAAKALGSNVHFHLCRVASGVIASRIRGSTHVIPVSCLSLFSGSEKGFDLLVDSVDFEIEAIEHNSKIF